MKSQKPSYYQIGLGDKFLFRAKIIFAVALLITLGLSGSAIYAGVTSGQLDKNIIQPVKSFIAATLEESAKVYPTPSLTPVDTLNITNSTSTADIKINITTNPARPNSSVSNQRTYITPTYSPRATPTPGKSWEETVNEMNQKADQQYQDALKKQQEWANQKKAENDAWFKQQSEAAQQAQNDWWAQQQKSVEEWKKQNGF